jgi:hypothetical protein
VKESAGLVLVGLTRAVNGFGFGLVDKENRTGVVEVRCGYPTILTFTERKEKVGCDLASKNDRWAILLSADVELHADTPHFLRNYIVTGHDGTT